MEAQAAGRSLYGLNQYILNFMVLPDDSLVVPRGLRAEIIKQAKDLGLDYKLVDRRSKFDHIDIDSSKIKYRPYQFDAVLQLMRHGPEGILVAPAGSGKTIIGLSLVPLVGQPTLWLTHTGPLADQAIDRAKSFLPNIGEVGLIGMNKWVKGDVLTVGMIQTLVRNPKRLAEMMNDFGMVILDECLVAGTKVLMLDGSEENIEDVVDGNVTSFGTVSNKFSRLTNTVIKIRGGWGQLVGTPTHRLPIIKASSLEMDKSINQLRPVEESDVGMSTMTNINRGDLILVRESSAHVEKHSIGTSLSRLLALIACDGHITKDRGCLQVGIIKDKEWFLSEMEIGASIFDDSVLKTSTCTRGDLIIRNYSEKAVNFVNKFVEEGKKTNLIVPPIIEHAMYEDIKNYLQVVFDTEGGLNRNQITITMSMHEFLLGIQHLLRKFGITSRVIPIKRKGYLRLAMSGYDAFLFYHKIGFSMKRKQEELFEIVKRCNKFVRRVTYRGAVYRCVEVLTKQIINKPTVVYDFTTEDHLFLANGVLSSNCHHCPARTFLEVVCRLNPMFLYGLTATPYRRDNLEALMFQAIGPAAAVIPMEKVESYGGIIVPVVRCKSIYHPEKVDDNNIQRIIKENIVENKSRTKIIVDDVVREAKSGHFCIVISDRRKHCEVLFKQISTQWPQTGITTGEYSKKQIQEQVDKFNNNEITVLVATFSLMGEGFDVPFLDRAFICMPFRAEAKTEQLIGRIQRSYPSKKDAVVYDYIDNNIGVLENQFFSKYRDCRHKTYTRLGVAMEPC